MNALILPVHVTSLAVRLLAFMSPSTSNALEVESLLSIVTPPLICIESLSVICPSSNACSVSTFAVVASTLATIVAVAVSVTEVTVAAEADVTALNLSSPSFQ